ncbi:hypothetical protein NMG60_11004352 [Bertholletia excelsa]
MASGMFKRFVEEKMGRIPRLVIFAVLEWLLIALLIIERLFAYLSKEFSNCFGLKMPCVFCTRIDHRSSFFDDDSLCESHKKEISFLAYCHAHQNLSHIHSMCEACLLSFASLKTESIEKESDADMYKSLMKDLRRDIGSFLGDDQKIDAKSPAHKIGTHPCSCCGEPTNHVSSSPRALVSSSPRSFLNRIRVSSSPLAPLSPALRARLNGSLKSSSPRTFSSSSPRVPMNASHVSASPRAHVASSLPVNRSHPLSDLRTHVSSSPRAPVTGSHDSSSPRPHVPSSPSAPVDGILASQATVPSSPIASMNGSFASQATVPSSPLAPLSPLAPMDESLIMPQATVSSSPLAPKDGSLVTKPTVTESCLALRDEGLVSKATVPSCPLSPVITRKNVDLSNSELPSVQTERDSVPVLDQQSSGEEDNETVSELTSPESVDTSEDAKTPVFITRNQSSGIQVTDSPSVTPRWTSRLPRKLQIENSNLHSESNNPNAATAKADSDSFSDSLKTEDRKSTVNLYMDRDEETSSAANNAVDVTNHLRAEKTAVQTETLQHERNMNEQEPYDQEEMDLLIRRKEEIGVDGDERELDETYREEDGLINRVANDERELGPDEDYEELSDYGENEFNIEGYQTLQELLSFQGEKRPSLMGLSTDMENKFRGPADGGIVYDSDDEYYEKYENIGYEIKQVLTREVSRIKESLEAIEADRRFVRLAASAIQKREEGKKILSEFAFNLRGLWQSVEMSLEGLDD